MNVRLIGIGVAVALLLGIGGFFAWRNAFNATTVETDPDFGDAPILRMNAEQHSGTIYRAGVSADGRLLATAGSDNVVKIWRLREASEGGREENLRLVNTLRVPISNEAASTPSAAGLRAVDISPDGTRVAAAGQILSDGTYRILVLDTATGEIVHDLATVPGVVADVAFSPDGQWLAAGAYTCSSENPACDEASNGLWVWNTANWEEAPYRDPDYAGRINGIGFNQTGDLFTASYDRQLRRYTAEERRTPDFRPRPAAARPFAPNHDADMRPYDLDVSPDGQTVLVGYLNDQTENAPAALTLYTASDLSPVRDFDLGGLLGDNGQPVQATIVNGVSFSNDGAFVYANIVQHQSGTSDKKIRRWPVAASDERPLDYDLCTSQTVIQVLPYQARGAIFVSSDPCISLIGDDGHRLDRVREIYDISNAELPPSDPGLLLVSEAGDRIYVAHRDAGKGVAFNLLERRLVSNPSATDPSRESVGNLYTQTSGQTTMTGWCCTGSSPQINGIPIALDGYVTWSTDVTQSGDFAVLGTSGGLYRYNRDGSLGWRYASPDIPRRVNITPNEMTVVALYRDGVIRWHSADTGEVLLNLFINQDGEGWAMWTEAGYFDASVGGDHLLGWHLNQGRASAPSWISISRYANVFRRPDIINDVIESIRNGVTSRGASQVLTTSASPTLANETIRDTAPPIVRIVDARMRERGREMLVTYVVTSPSGDPVRTLRIDVNGRALAPQRGPIRTGQRLQVNVPIARSDVYVAIRGENRYGRGEVATVNVVDAFHNTAEGAPPPVPEHSPDPFGDLPPLNQRPVLHALVVGVEYKYRARGNLRELCCAVDDARDFAQFLDDQNTHDVHALFRDVQVTLLTDEQATLDALHTHLSRLSRVDRKDVILIFLAGHGVSDDLGRGHYNFIPYGVDPQSGPLENTALTGRRITETLQNSRAPAILMMDTCNSQGALERSFLNDVFNLETNIFAFTSSRDGQASTERRAWGNGAFTRAFLSAARGEASGISDDDMLTYSELGPYLREQVVAMTDGEQVPQYFGWGPQGANPQANLFAVRRR